MAGAPASPAQRLRELCECNICLSLFDDPWLCSDGFVYCRGCIGRWIGRSEEWISPRTNQRFDATGAILGRDLQRACLVLEIKRAHAAELVHSPKSSSAELLASTVQLACCRHEGLPAAEPVLLRSLLDAVFALPAEVWARPTAVECYAMLELAVVAGWLHRIAALPPVVRGLLRADRAAAGAPFLRFGILKQLLREIVKGGCHQSTFAGRRALVRHFCAHLLYRAPRRDLVDVSEACLESRQYDPNDSGTFVRADGASDDVRAARRPAFRCTERDALLLLSQASAACPDEDVQSTLRSRGALWSFLSQRTQWVPPSWRFWPARRGVATENPLSPEQEGPSNLPPDLLVFEEALEVMPRGFRYHPNMLDLPLGVGFKRQLREELQADLGEDLSGLRQLGPAGGSRPCMRRRRAGELETVLPTSR
jgi:hypothetical protein